MAWFSKEKKLKTREAKPNGPPGPRAAGLWYQCEACSEVSTRAEYEKAFHVCPRCGQHDTLPVRRRFELILDPGTFEEQDRELAPADPLGFADSKRYRDRLRSTVKATGLKEAFVSATGSIAGQPVSVGAFAFEFMGGSMGSVVGEKVTRLFDRATERRIPVLVFSSSGGARMQEGIFSLMQMAKTSTAIHRFRAVQKPFISVMLHPTTGGVAASFAWLGDVVLAEPRALIGFAGPRVIEQTIREKLPPGFQRSEFLLEHGMVDAIVPRHELREKLAQLIGLLA